MTVYRIVSLKYSEDLTGGGALLYGGRWNEPGIRAVYTSGSISLALLETLCHTSFQMLPADMQIVHITIPANIKVKKFPHEVLPHDWRAIPAYGASRTLGTKLLLKNEYAVLGFPSAVVPHEQNYVLNPEHRDYHQIKIIKTEPLSLDKRLVSEIK